MLSFSELERLHRAFAKITFNEFRFALQASLGHNVDEEYAQTRWSWFQDNPVAFMMSRNPIEQGEALFRIVMRHVRDEKTPR